MTKLYYDYAIQAAYMEKEFGVRLCNKHGETINLVLVHIDDNERINIHPDSLHIFEPQVGDVYFYPDDVPDTYYTFKDDDIWAENVVIIRRNNKPFIWPLIEEDE